MSSSNSSQRGASRRSTGSTSSRKAPAKRRVSPPPASRSRSTSSAPGKTRARRAPSRPSSRPSPRRIAPAGPWVPLAVVALLVVCGWALYPALRLQYQTSRRVGSLEQQYDALRQRNQTLKAQVAELKTPAGVAKVAADSLGFVKQGDNVYVVTGTKASQTASGTASLVSGDRSALQVILDAIFGVETAPTPDRAP